jgi:RNA polymerase sigma-70 factor (ECF subfamily)
MEPPMNTLQKPDYPELIARVLEDDHQAFEELMEQSHLLVRKVAAPLVPDSVIDDVVQETYLQVYRKLHHLREPQAFLGWLSRITINMCSQWRRKARPTNELKPEHAVSEPESTRVDFRAALRQLTSKERNTVILREHIGLSYEEISRAINIPIGTVRSRLAKARKKLKALLQDVTA